MTEYIIALAELLEAEGRLLRRTVMRTGVALSVVIVAALILVGGLGLCLWAAYQGLSGQLGVIKAALIIGMLMLVLAGGLTWMATRLAR